MCEFKKQDLMSSLNAPAVNFKEITPGTQYWSRVSADKVPKNMPSQVTHFSQYLIKFKKNVSNSNFSNSVITIASNWKTKCSTLSKPTAWSATLSRARLLISLRGTRSLLRSTWSRLTCAPTTCSSRARLSTQCRSRKTPTTTSRSKSSISEQASGCFNFITSF